MNSKILYSCISGNYDEVQTHEQTKGWDSVVLRISGSTIDARRMKILCPYFDEYKLSIWVDGNFKVVGDLNEFVAKHHKQSISAMAHPFRSCIYDELQACLKYRKDIPMRMIKQIHRYKREKMPRNLGMISSGILIREHISEVKTFCQKWMNEVEAGSIRDQLSFNYVAWKTDFKYHTFPYFDDLHYFRYTKH